MFQRSTGRRVATLLLGFTVLVGCSQGVQRSDANAAGPEPPGDSKSDNAARALPRVTPQPRDITRVGADVPVRGTVELIAGDAADRSSRDLVARVLREAGADEVVPRKPGAAANDDAALRVHLGKREEPGVRDGLRAAGADPATDIGSEGYQLAVRADAEIPEVVIGADDSTGVYYGTQTLRQLATPGTIAGARVVDSPRMPVRGAIEGFYGSPWTHQERMNQLAFYGENKLNTYVYAPKDDPYHREKWREPYPKEKMSELRELIDRAKSRHVNFTYAIHPGSSICFSDPDDFSSLQDKLQQLYDNGVRDFQVLFDDIEYDSWNCSADEEQYGPASAEAAGQAQADVLNRVQEEFVAQHPDTAPVQTVPTEYSDMDESGYKRALRTELDSDVDVMWTGDGVIPDGISVDDAKRAGEVWGRDPLIWDNYPVNDFDETAGRLLMGPYAKRENGLSEHANGIVANPMNQAAASKVVELGEADFAWNDKDFDANRAWRTAADYLAGDSFASGEAGLTADKSTANALRVFFDLNRMAPLSGDEPWLEQAPGLARQIDEFRTTWNSGDKRQAVRSLRGYAERVRSAPDTIRQGADGDFVADADPWLTATDRWGDSLLATLDGLRARADDDQNAAREHFARAQQARQAAEQVHTIPGETRPQGPIRIADGVLDTFIEQAPDM